MSDVGFTHVALLVGDLDASIAFYAKYAHMEIVHQRTDGSSRVAWVSDRTRPFVIVLIEVPTMVPRPLLRWANTLVRLLVPFEHMGVGCASREEVDRLCAEAKAEGRLSRGPHDAETRATIRVRTLRMANEVGPEPDSGRRHRAARDSPFRYRRECTCS